jgi:hypothetical protein
MSRVQVFIGYDAREAIAYEVLKYSILRRASIDVNVRPLITADIPIYTRPRHPNQTTDFAFTRFLVPYLSGYEGVSIFMDCDMLMRADIKELLNDVPERCAVAVCPHDYTPKTTTKFLDQPQTAYPRKNWSSLMVFQNSECRRLTPYYVNRASAADLHRLAWVPDNAIGSLPLDWNWLVGEYAPNPTARCYHWTLGGPWFVGSEDVDHADLWREEFEHMRAAKRKAAS